MVVQGNIEGHAIQGSINRLYELQGYSAYDIAVLNGFVGTEAQWLASLKGDKGDPGEVIHTDADGDVLEDVFIKRNPVYQANKDTLADVIRRADEGATIQLLPGEYPLLTFTGDYGLERAETDNPLPGTVLKYPENLTILGGEGVTVAGISITSGVMHPDQYTTTDTLRNRLPGGLTLKNLNLSDSICLRNCTMDGLNILACYLAAGANIQIHPNTYTDKFGKDSTSSSAVYTDNAGTFVSNVVIRGNTIEDAFTSATDTDTTAILVCSVNNVTIHSNTINKAPFNGVQVNSRSGSYSTGKIGISNNTIKNTGSRSIRIANLRNAKVFVCSNDLYDANLADTISKEQIAASDCYNTTYSWLMSATSGGGSNSYRENGKVVIAKLTVGNGINIYTDVNDRLLAQGVTNGWTWKKWENGEVELWKRTVARSSYDEQLPFKLVFSDDDVPQCNPDICINTSLSIIDPLPYVASIHHAYYTNIVGWDNGNNDYVYSDYTQFHYELESDNTGTYLNGWVDVYIKSYWK